MGANRVTKVFLNMTRMYNVPILGGVEKGGGGTYYNRIDRNYRCIIVYVILR